MQGRHAQYAHRASVAGRSAGTESPVGPQVWYGRAGALAGPQQITSNTRPNVSPAHPAKLNVTPTLQSASSIAAGKVMTS